MNWDSLQAAIVGPSLAEHEIVATQKEVGVSQDGSPLVAYSTRTQMWDASRANTDISPLVRVAEVNDNHIPGGVSPNECEYGLKNYRDESNSWKPQGVETVHGGHVPLSHEQQRHVLTYPLGEVCAVRITDRDIQSLQPKCWLRDSIIDFYIMYLERHRLPLENKDHVYFFNSCFFTKLVASTTQGMIGYEQVQNWTKNVNLFEKKYIFIPVKQSSYWSLAIICNLAISSYEQISSPCILHLDSLKGRGEHDSVEIYRRNDLVETSIRQYIIEAWKEKHQGGSDDQLGSLRSMKLVQAEVPQQDNGYDCGIYLLHYIERFFHVLEFPSMGHSFDGWLQSRLSSIHLQSAWMDHSLDRIPGIWFESSEVSKKRSEIEHILMSLPHMTRTCFGDKGAQRAATQPAQNQTVAELTEHNRVGPPVTSLSTFKRDKRKRNSNWTDDETSILVKCKKEAAVDNGSRFCKGKPDITNWDTIAESINSNFGTRSIPRTGDQCRLRWDTLVKSYQRANEHCKRSKKEFSELTRNERVELKLATTLSKDQWYEVIDQFYPPKSRKRKPQKLDDVAPSVNTLPCIRHNSAHYNTPIQIGTESFEATEPSTKEPEFREFSTISSDLIPIAFGPSVQSDIGNNASQEAPGKEVGMAQGTPEWSVMHEAGHADFSPLGSGSQVPIQTPVSEPIKLSRRQVAIPGFNSMSQDLRFTIFNLVQAWPTFSISSEIEDVCRWLAIVQDRSPSETRSYVYKLLNRNLLTISSRDEGACKLMFPPLRVYKKFVKVVISKHLDYNIHDRVLQVDSVLISFELSSVPDRIRVLTLYKCAKLERVDLGELPMLRSLSIKYCDRLTEVLGWETLSELGWLEISGCGELHNEHLRVHCLPSLKQFSLGYCCSSKCLQSTGFKLDFSHCIRLLKVKMEEENFAKSVDLSTLKCLEELDFSSCARLENIVGWNELHSLTKVKLHECWALKLLPYLGHLKALVNLDLSLPSVETITGLQSLHSLTHLTLLNCSALKRLPDLGGLKRLSYLKISLTNVDAIRGLDKLHSLTHLVLFCCKALKRLPYLGDLKVLAHLDISWSSVDEIPGVRELVNLKTLDCTESQLEWLPDLGHLPRLNWISLSGTPLVMVPSSKYSEKRKVKFNGVKWAEEVADVSDSDYVPSDQEIYDKDNPYQYFKSSDVSDIDG